MVFHMTFHMTFLGDSEQGNVLRDVCHFVYGGHASHIKTTHLCSF